MVTETDILEIFAEVQVMWYPYQIELDIPKNYRAKDYKLGFNAQPNLEGLNLGRLPKLSEEQRKANARAKAKRQYERNKETILAKRKAKRAVRAQQKKVQRSENRQDYVAASWRQVAD